MIQDTEEPVNPATLSSGPSYIETPAKIPVFIFPGVLQNVSECVGVVEGLRAKGHNRTMYVWTDPLLTTPGFVNNTQSDTLLGQAKSIAEILLEKYQFHGSTPHLLVGMSYGCSVAALVAEILQQKGLDPRLLLIDGPTPECSKEYFSYTSDKLTNDLLNIVEYAARLSLKEIKSNETLSHFLVVDDARIKNLQSASPQDIITKAAQIIIDDYPNSFNPIFFKYIALAKRNVNNHITAPDITLTSKFDHIVTLTTIESENKYKDANGGWGKYGEIFPINNPALRQQKHTDLLKISLTDTENLLTKEVDSFINQNATLETLFATQVRSLLRNFVGPENDFHISPSVIKSLSDSQQLQRKNSTSGKQAFESSSSKILRTVTNTPNPPALEIPTPIESSSSSSEDKLNPKRTTDIFNRQLLLHQSRFQSRLFNNCRKEGTNEKTPTTTENQIRQKCS